MSSSHDASVAPSDRGTHHCRNTAASLHARRPRRAGASTVRVTTTSVSDAFVTLVFLSVSVGIRLLLLLEVFEHVIQRVEPRVPQLAIAEDPLHLVLQPGRADPAGP